VSIQEKVAAIDGLILERVANLEGKCQMYDIVMDGKVFEEVIGLGSSTYKTPYNVLNRRLFALRKAGVLTYSKKNGWAVKKPVAHSAQIGYSPN